MKQAIRDDQTIEEVQDIFHHLFPFLKVDFFERDTHGLKKDKFNRPAINAKKLFGEFRLDKIDGGDFVIAKDIRISQLEQYIDSNYCLHVQVFRKTGNVWLETTITNNWTLDEQNRQGEIITLQMSHHN
ncbi:MAG: hypothetical protein ABI581_14555 [Sediminibacterium sp.]